jgi:uncharacterized protein DUF4062
MSSRASAENRRHQVFVSSTFLDLKEERAAVVSALLQMDAFPAGMELFPAADDDAWTLIKRVIDSSDYYLLVVGGKYGSVDPETDLSFTEKEYDYAIEQEKPVMAFLHEDPESIEFGRSEKDQVAQEKLASFREKIESAKHVKYWKGPDDLAGKVALSFASFRKTYPAVGWVRGDLGASSETLEELNDLRKQIVDLEKANSSSGPPAGASALAQGTDLTGFSFPYSVRVRRNIDESWQSTAYVGKLQPRATWDDLFSSVGPELLHEADERSIRGRIQNWLIQEFGERVQTLTKEVVEGAGNEVSSFVSVEFEIADEDFGTLIIQMRALGLITKSERARSVKDTETYWTLTSHGDAHLTTLRAIRKNQTPEAPVPSVVDSGEEEEEGEEGQEANHKELSEPSSNE